MIMSDSHVVLCPSCAGIAAVFCRTNCFNLCMFYRIHTSRRRSLKFLGLRTSYLQWAQWRTER